jgi:hypothetical protein
MSIFKQTLSKTIQDQLAARTKVVSGVNNNRSLLLPWYLSKNSWTRMTSMVNYTSGKVDFVGDGSVKITKDGYYTDQELAMKNILQGGQLYIKNNNSDIASLRKNIAVPDGAYGGSFDVRGDGKTADPTYYRQFGTRPMPGITSVRLNTVSAYGSLFETNVSFYAWDNHQLNELEILFMRPGYSVLLEWGWSQYIDNNNQPTVFSGLTVPAFKNLNQQDIYDQIEGLRIKHDHNYDGMLGYVKNFSWKMLKNGGYECNTTLISMGEAINTLKISTNNIKINEKPSFDTTSKDNYVYDDFENIFISLKGTGELYLTKTSDGKKFLDEELYKGNWNYDKNYISRDRIVNQLKIKKIDENIIKRLQQQPYIKQIKSGNENQNPEGKSYEYISLDVFVAIVDTYFNLQITSKKSSNSIDNIVNIIPPGQEDYCLASRDSISVDPSVCLVSNPLAFEKEFLKGLNPAYDKNKGVVSPVKQTLAYANSNYYRSGLGTLPLFYNDTLKVGYIGDIYVNISLLLNEYKNIKNSSNDEGVNLTVYFKNILNKISNALGGLNNFSLSTAGRDQNTLRIIDLYYLEKNSGEDKYEFDLMGLNTIVRDANVESQIFENQSTIVAIAAQSRANLGDVYNSTQVYLNAGIEDRVAISKAQPGELNNFENKVNSDNVFYAKLFNFLLYVRDNVVGADSSDDYAISTSNSGTVPYSFLKQFMLKYNGELNFKALLPFKLNIKLDGIGGIVVGEVFKVKTNILPQNYADKNLGFVITKISHDLTNNDWETTLETQICLLDNITLGEKFINVNRNGFKEYYGELVKEAILYPILLNFVQYIALKVYIIALNTSYEDGYRSNQFSQAARILNGNENLLNSEKEILTTTSARIKETLSKNRTVSVSPNKQVNIFGLNNFRTYFEEWVKLVKTSPEIGAQFTPTKTYGNVLDELIQSNVIDTISAELVKNLDMFDPLKESHVWKGVFNNPTEAVLNQNISNLLISKNIISSDLKNAYDLGALDDKTYLKVLVPINSSFKDQLYTAFTLSQPGRLVGPGRTEIRIIFKSSPELLKQWFNVVLGTDSRDITDDFNEIVKNLFFYNV